MSSVRLPPPYPGEVLSGVLAVRGLTAYRIAAIVRIPYERTHAVVKGRRKIAPDTALRLERAPGEPPAEYWPGLQASCDPVLAREAPGRPGRPGNGPEAGK